ncbi:MAG: biotin/lipoyl-containing protein, partial [Candidatus Dormibacteria bacterium]
MAETVTMPQLGESVVEGTIAKWLKQPGDPVARYEMIVSVVTDKVDTEIPAPAEGTMGRLIAAEGAVVAVGDPICTIETATVAGAPTGGSPPEVGEVAGPPPVLASAPGAGTATGPSSDSLGAPAPSPGVPVEP